MQVIRACLCKRKIIIMLDLCLVDGIKVDKAGKTTYYFKVTRKVVLSEIGALLIVNKILTAYRKIGSTLSTTEF